MPTPASLWHETPQARALLARLTRADFREEKRLGIPADYYVLVAETDNGDRTLAALEELREVAPDIELGYTYASTQQPFDRPAAERYLDCRSTMPSVIDVVLGAVRGRERNAA